MSGHYMCDICGFGPWHFLTAEGIAYCTSRSCRRDLLALGYHLDPDDDAKWSAPVEDDTEFLRRSHK